MQARAITLATLIAIALLLAACGPPPVAAGPPTVSIVLPADGVTYAAGTNVLVVVQGADAGAGIARVVLYADGVEAAARDTTVDGSGLAAISTSFDWTAAVAGPHELTVIAYRADGTTSDAARVGLQVTLPSPTPPPTATATPPPPTPTETPVPPTPADDPPTDVPLTDDPGEESTSAVEAVTATGTNVRDGPGVGYAVIFTLLADTPVTATGRDANQLWYQVAHYPNLPDRSWVRQGWIYTDNLSMQDEGGGLPVVEVAPPVAAAQAPVQPAAQPAAPAAAPASGEPLVALNSPIRETGREICENPMLLGPQVHLGYYLHSVNGWWQEEYVGVPLEGGVTEQVRSQWRDWSNVVNLHAYLHERYARTAVEMGGTWRTFYWSIGQSDVPVQAGRQYTVTAIFHPFVQVNDGSGGEIWANAANTPGWENLLLWRWVVVGSDGTTVADWWHNGSTLGTDTWNIPPQNELYYRFSFAANRDDAVSVRVEFQNTWPIAVTKVWMHAMHCYEF